MAIGQALKNYNWRQFGVFVLLALPLFALFAWLEEVLDIFAFTMGVFWLYPILDRWAARLTGDKEAKPSKIMVFVCLVMFVLFTLFAVFIGPLMQPKT